jgi:hypothetical protein
MAISYSNLLRHDQIDTLWQRWTETSIYRQIDIYRPFLPQVGRHTETMADERVIEEINLDDDNEVEVEVECLADVVNLTDENNDMMDVSSQDDIVDITPPPAV